MQARKQYSSVGFWLALTIAISLVFGMAQPALASPSTAPKAPSDLKGKYYPLNIAKLTWKDNSSDEASFNINMDFDCPPKDGLPGMKGGVAFVMKANTTSANVKMDNGCKYTITIQAVGKNKDLSAKSNTVNLVAPPIPPTSLSVTKGKTNYDIKWADKSDNEGIFVVAIGYKSGVTVYGFKKNTTSAAIPASAIPASAKYEWMVGAIPASAIPASFTSGKAIPASILNNLAIPNDSDMKFLTNSSYLPLIVGSNMVTTK